MSLSLGPLGVLHQPWQPDFEGVQLHGAGATLLIGTTAATTALTIGRTGITTTFPGDVSITGTLVVIGGETFEGLVTVTSAAGAGAAGALGPQELLVQNTQAATAGATIRAAGYIDWQGRFWETTGGTSVSQNYGRFGAVVDTITAATGVPLTYRLVWANTAGTIQWGVTEVGQARAGDGTAAFPSQSFLSQTNKGHYSAGADLVGVSTAGVPRGEWSSAGLRLVATAAPAGSDSHELRWTGVTSVASRAIGVLTEADAGTDTYRLRFNDNAGSPILELESTGQILAEVGTEAAPPYSFRGQAAHGWRSTGANVIAYSAANFTYFDLGAGVINIYEDSGTGAGTDSTQLRFQSRVVGAAARLIAIRNEGDAGVDAYRLAINDSGGARIWELESTGRQSVLAGGGGYRVMGAMADVNPQAVLALGSLSFGTGAGAAVDTVLSRQAASVFATGDGDSFYAVNATLGVRAAAADANATADLTGAGLRLGAGGVTAVDWIVARRAASIAELGSGDSLYSVGAATIGRRALSDDANATAAITANGFELGVGGVTALDWLLQRQAASIAELGTGDALYSVGAGALGHRNATGDATPRWEATGTAISFYPVGVAAGNTYETRWLELAASGTNYVGFKAADALAGNVIWTLPTADGVASAALTTSGAGILSWTAGAGYFAGGPDVALADGGTSASLVASLGGIFYSTATAGAILAGTATANQALLSGASAAPAWSTATYPATTTINQLLYSSAANTLAGLATAASGLLVTSAGGVPSIATDIPTAVTIGAAYIYRVGGTDVALADGGTGASTAAAARTNLGLGSGDSPTWTGGTFTGDLLVQGNFAHQGSTQIVTGETVLIGDNHLWLNHGYTTAVAQTGGLTVNYLPTATNDTVAAAGFVAGVPAVSNPTVGTAGAATFALADLIQISGATEEANNGLFEVLSHAANVLTIRGIGLTATVEDFTQNQFVASAGAVGVIRKVTVSVLRAGTDGVWESGSGSVTGMTFGDLYRVGGADVAVADGGTGASTAGGARTNLGLVIGTDVQAFDATLLSIAALGTVADRIAYTTALDTWAETPLTAAGRALIDDATAAAQRTTLGLVIGTDVQAFDATLLSLAALGTVADRMAYTTALDTWAETPLTAAGRALIDDASAAAQRTTLGLVIGTDVQAFDATLNSLAALGTAADRFAYTTGIDTWAEATLTAAGRAILDDASAAAQRTTLGLVIGTDVQAFDATLNSIAALGTVADRIAYTTGIDTWAETALTAAGRALIDDASAAVQRATLGVTIRIPDLTAAAEVGNAIAVTIDVQDQDGSAVAAVTRLHCQVYDASMLEALVGAFTCAETGAGTEVSTSARPGLLIDTDANGDATVTVTDVSASFVGTVYLEVVPVIAESGGTKYYGQPSIIPLVFA